MLTPDTRTSETLQNAGASVFQLLGGELSAVDPWTRVDFAWMHEGAERAGDSVGYAGLPMSYRIAGLTLGDADAAPKCPPFMVEIWPERLIAQVFWPRNDRFVSALASEDLTELQHWAAGSLTKNLRVVRFGDGDLGLEADLFVADSTAVSALREFVTAFSWDVAALHARETGDVLRTTEEWVRMAALSISRATPTIPLREHDAPEWRSFESPRGMFCSLQPSGGLCESDNVLYAVRRDMSMLSPIATMPGHRSDWDYSRLTDVWLARDAAACFARSLLCDGFVTTDEGAWRKLNTKPVTAVAPWGRDGFLLGLHDGNLAVVDGAQSVIPWRRMTKIAGRFSRLVSLGDRAIGLIGSTLASARLTTDAAGQHRCSDEWNTSFELTMVFDNVCDLDADPWSSVPSLSLLGDDAIAIVDVATGEVRARYSAQLAQQAKWIGPGLLLVLDSLESRHETRTRVRVLDVVSQRWTEPVVTAEITRVAIRDDEIHVGFANQTIAVWDRREVCRGIGAWAFRTDVPEMRAGDPATAVIQPVVEQDRSPGRAERA